MATTQGARSNSYIAGADLSAATNQFRLVKLSAARTVILCSAGTDLVEGVLATGNISGYGVEVQTEGMGKVQAGAAFTAGAQLMADATGRAITATSTNRAFGIALVAATAAGDVVEYRRTNSGNLIA